MYLSYKPPSSWRILFRSGGSSRQLSCLKIQETGGPWRGLSYRDNYSMEAASLRFTRKSSVIIDKKGDVTVASIHATIQINSPYRQTFYDLSTRPDNLNILTHQSAVTNNAPREPLYDFITA